MTDIDRTDTSLKGSPAPAPRPSRGAGEVLILGSVNHDRFVTVDRLPAAGETITALSASEGIGGKGANQAVAAALAGARVTFAGAVGDDASGALARQTLVRMGVDDHPLRTMNTPTGAAFITVDEAGENTIVVLPGANGTVGPNALSDIGAREPSVVVTQGELPITAITAAAEFAAAHGSRFVLNLAPVLEVPAEVLRQADPLIVNEHEAAGILECDPPTSVTGALALSERLIGSVRSLVITIGSAGAVVQAAGAPPLHIPAPTPPGPVVDTTGAGDAFVGVLAARLAEGESLHASAQTAARAASISVSRAGTMTSYPGADEMDAWPPV
ncbi:MAG: ribokinase [Microbacterium hominis]|jgi:ribokinase|uniref:ribokinase n=1 Tax=Microbacterium aurum TaxID=36805 RepID=UPI00248E82F0|nr:ribokinase [Microbacterium aurum]MBZ6371563.1 ribokinase [Microbacterium hominis]